METDTIAAVATAMSQSGIGIVRISGKNAVPIADQLYRTKSGKRALSGYPSHTIHYGFLYDGEDFLDEAMVSVMRAPKSYTTEDTVELNCHGGVFIVNRVLQAVLKRGARLAEPGEFTKRAFLNGRIDLSRAEAVMDLISAESEAARKISAKQLQGSLYRFVKEMREKILYEIALIESALDDPEHSSLDGYGETLFSKVESMLSDLDGLLRRTESGRILKEGISTVIVGKPNAGKSSLLNALSGAERAIVTEIAGTTRDALEEHIRLGGLSLNLLDTAGIRSTADPVEKIGVERARQYAADADLILYVMDLSVPISREDEEILSLISEKKTIVLLNKTDLPPALTEEALASFLKEKEDWKVIQTSMKEKTGIDELEKTITELFFQGSLSVTDEVLLTNVRQKERMQDAYTSLSMVRQSILNQMPEDFLSIDLMGAYTSLGLIIGEEVGDDLVNEIFSKFCMGK